MRFEFDQRNAKFGSFKDFFVNLLLRNNSP